MPIIAIVVVVTTTATTIVIGLIIDFIVIVARNFIKEAVKRLNLVTFALGFS